MALFLRALHLGLRMSNRENVARLKINNKINNYVLLPM
jgi:hypothetical protein